MVKFYLSDGQEVSIEEFRRIGKSQDGELVLLLSKRQVRLYDSPASMNLGVLRGISFGKYNTSLILSCFYTIEPSEKLGGIDVPMIIVPNYRKAYRERNHILDISTELISAHLGQEQIVKELREYKSYQAHADWIARLRKPYSAK